MEPTVEHALQTPDGYWRVEVVKYGPKQRWYRIWHTTTVLADRVPLSTVQRVLAEAYPTLQPVELDVDAGGVA